MGQVRRDFKIRIAPFDDGHIILIIFDITMGLSVERIQTEFIANVSHELRSPLTALTGFIETLQTSAKEDDSARGEEGDRSLGLDSGADDYVSKPFSPRELVARVKALLRRARPSLLQDILEFHGLTLNPETMRVERDGDLIHLGAKEFRLLSVLIERPERVFSREQLLDMVWGHGVYIEERTVDVHMSRLRRALNRRAESAENRPDIIRTVRGAGYSLSRPGT